MFELVVGKVGFGGLDEGMVGVEGVLADVDHGFVKIHARGDKFVKAGKGGEKCGDFVELDDGGPKANELQSLVAAKAEGDFLVKAVVAAGLAGVKLAKVGLGDAEETGGAEDFFYYGEFDSGGGGFDADGVDEVEAEIFVAQLNVVVGLLQAGHFLVRLPGVKRGDEDKWDLQLLGNAPGIGGQDAEAAAAADAV